MEGRVDRIGSMPKWLVKVGELTYLVLFRYLWFERVRVCESRAAWEMVSPRQVLFVTESNR